MAANDPSNQMKIIMIAGKNAGDRARYQAWLADRLSGVMCIFEEVENIRDARLLLEKCRPDCIVLDAPLSGEEAANALLAEMRRHEDTPPGVVILTGADDAPHRDSAAAAYLPKQSLTAEGLGDTVHRLMQLSAAA